MKNPVNRLATAAPRALDSILAPKERDDVKDSKNEKKLKRRERTCSFDVDLSGLALDSPSGGMGGGSSVGMSAGSIAEEGSVVTFEDLSEFAELGMDWGGDGAPSPN